MATTGTQMPGVFVALHATAAQNAHGLDAQGLALCTAAAQEVQVFNTHDVANTLWAIVKTGTQMSDASRLCAQ